MVSRYSVLLTAGVQLIGTAFNAVHVAHSEIFGPPESVEFGASVTVLSNGNIVVCDPARAPSNTGAVYLYGPSGNLISTLTGSGPENEIGSDGITELTNGNFVVGSSKWDAPNAINAGAVTWVNGVTGLSGVVSAANSLVGSTLNDRVADRLALPNGNYLVHSPSWDSASAINVGAVTWGNGISGISGEISLSNSSIGTSADDAVGNSGITLLDNGNAVVTSITWDDATLTNVGAVTWINGATGLTGTISAQNSLIGHQANTFLGNAGVTALRNGNYVISSSSIANGAARNAGAVTLANGSTGLTGVFDPNTSLLGSTAFDRIGERVHALSNGNYVIQSPAWDFGLIQNVGAIMWADGNVPIVGVISPQNALIGSSANDAVGDNVTALGNGNYVVCSANWDNAGIADVGAVLWASGSKPLIGPLRATEALTGSKAGDKVGINGVTALTNGNYVIASPQWSNETHSRVGAMTWAHGTSTTSAVISADNSLVGNTTDDLFGSVIPLRNGNYVVRAPGWDSGSIIDAGAIVWANGSVGRTGVITPSNALVGSQANDALGSSGVAVLSNGNYVISSPDWNNGVSENIGAVTWANGTTGLIGEVNDSTSLTGTVPDDRVGDGGAHAFANGSYAIYSAHWRNGAITNAGAISLSSAIDAGLVGSIDTANSVLGSIDDEGSTMSFDYDAARGQLVVGRPQLNRVSLFTLSGDLQFANGFE